MEAVGAAAGWRGQLLVSSQYGAFALVISSSHLQRVLRIFVKRLGGKVEGRGCISQ